LSSWVNSNYFSHAPNELNRESVEYAHDTDYDKDEGGTGESRDTVTVQIAYEL